MPDRAVIRTFSSAGSSKLPSASIRTTPSWTATIPGCAARRSIRSSRTSRAGCQRSSRAPGKSRRPERRRCRSPSAVVGANRDMTVVRIPLKSAKHHFGVSLSRGSRPYNEDAFQAGTIEVPAFAKRRPMSLTRKGGAANEVTPADSASGDPQVFYFGVFDGHGGAVCSGFLREQLHDYLEKATQQFELQSSLRRAGPSLPGSIQDPSAGPKNQHTKDKESLEAIQTH